MDEIRLFETAKSTAERTRELAAWLRAAHGRELDAREAELVRWLLAHDAAKVPLDLVLATDGLAVFLNPHQERAASPHIDDEQELAFVTRFASFDADRAKLLQLSMYRYMAFMDIVEPDEFFDGRADFEAQRAALAPLVGEAQDPPVFEFEGFAALAAHDAGVSEADAEEFDRLHMLYLAAMGVVDFENDAAGDAPSLAFPDERPDLAPGLAERPTS